MKLRALLYGAALTLSNLLLPVPQAQAVSPHYAPPALHTASSAVHSSS
jgi:hypothetical protein